MGGESRQDKGKLDKVEDATKKTDKDRHTEKCRERGGGRERQTSTRTKKEKGRQRESP